MPRYRMAFSKEGLARFLSHLELMRTWERVLRRAGLPISFSGGFNPHPKMSFASALAVGVASRAEYLDVELEEELGEAAIHHRVSQCLPEGLRLNKVVRVPDGAPPLMAVVNSALYRIKLKARQPISAGELSRSVAFLVQQPAIPVERTTKDGGKKCYDLKPMLFDLHAYTAGEMVEVVAEVQAGSSGNVRPEEVARALVSTGLAVDPHPFQVERLGLFIRKGGENHCPLEVNE